jgi:predicted acyl esterase
LAAAGYALPLLLPAQRRTGTYLGGDGSLSAEPPGDEPPGIYLYNPLRPVPSVGGQVILPGGNVVGLRDQRAVETRDDVLCTASRSWTRPSK